MATPINIKYYVTSLLFLIVGVTVAQIQAPGDCINAIQVCDTNPIYFETLGSGMIDDANGNLSMACHAKNSVNTYEDHTAFFKFTVNNSGQFGFYITPDVREDWEWILFGPNPDCTDLPNTPWAGCSSASLNSANTDGSTGLGPHPILSGTGNANGFNPYINVTTGEEYVLMIMPFVTVHKKATLYWQGTAVVNNSGIFTQPSCTAGIEDQAVRVSLYPNPVHEVLHIDATVNLTQAVVYDLNGKIVVNTELNEPQINLSELAKGLYFVEFTTVQGNRVVERFLKE